MTGPPVGYDHSKDPELPSKLYTFPSPHPKYSRPDKSTAADETLDPKVGKLHDNVPLDVWTAYMTPSVAPTNTSLASTLTTGAACTNPPVRNAHKRVPLDVNAYRFLS